MIEKLIILSFIAQGIYLVLNSKIFSFLQKIKNSYFQYFLACPVCQGFWVGFFLSLFKVISIIHPVVDGVITSAGSYYLKKIFELKSMEELK
jgi:hypothetical protein